MSGVEVPDGNADVQEDIDQAIAEALDLEFASYEDVQDAFRR